MTFTQLKYAIVVAEIQSINAAAKLLYISQPSLSSAIKGLEEELQITLYHRTNRGISLTAEGEEFIRYAKSVMTHYQLLEEKFIKQEDKKIKFSVSMHHSTFIAPLFGELVQKFGIENYEYALLETKTQNVLEDVKTEKSELGVLYLSNFNYKLYEKTFQEANLEFHLIAEFETQAYLGKQHPLANRKEIMLEELEAYPCLLFEQDANTNYDFYEEIISSYMYKNVIKTSDRATTMDLLKSIPCYSIGAGIVTESKSDEDIVSVRIQSKENILIGYLIRKGQKLSILGNWFVEKLREYVKE